MIKTAKQDIKLYKAFEGTNSDARAPFQYYTWGALRKGRVLEAGYFNENDGICRSGVHASKSKQDAELGGPLIWEVVIPKGTRYYQSSIPEAQEHYSHNARSSVYRAERMRLVREVR